MKSLCYLVLLSSVSLFSSCASYQQSTREFRNSWDQGNEAEALVKLEKAGKAIKPGHDEELLWNLEMSSVARANQLPQIADYHLDISKSLVDENFGGGLLDPQKKGLGEYVGKFHDRNVLEIIRACRFLELNDPNKVQSSFTELRFKREEARELNLKRIQDAESKAYENKNLKYNELVQSGEIKLEDFVNVELSKKYSDFYNPMGDYLRLVLKNRTNNALDFGASEFNLKQALGSRKKFLLQESSGNLKPVTYVFMETGSAPYRVEKKIRLPLALFFAGQPPGGVLYAPVAFPELQYRSDFDDRFIVNNGLTRAYMEELVDMDAVVSSEFKSDFPGEMAKAMIQTALAVAAQVAIEAATKKQQQDSLAVTLFATIAKVAAAEAFTQADDRSWYSLPKRILVQRVQTPPKGVIGVSTQSGQTKTFRVDSNSHTNFVFLKSLKQNSPIKVISNFTLDSAIAMSNNNNEDLYAFNLSE
ncbi:hypothetical protein N9J62_00915 [bacterium]|nr:hypothetical protein [bacterium]